jgi:serine/threonine-protein kinase RsbT
MTVVLARHEFAIAAEDDVVVVRRRVKEAAQHRKLDAFATAALTTAASELTRNAWVHAGGGKAVVEELGEGPRFGVRVVFEDSGPGISDLPRALAGGYSTTKTLGLGLSGSKRLVDRFEIDSTVGKGTRVLIEKWAPF